MWEPSGKLVGKLQGHEEGVNSAWFSPDGKRIVTASNDSTTRVWNLSSKLLTELQGRQTYVLTASFSPDGQRIVTASTFQDDSHIASVWDLSRKQLVELKGHIDRVNSASFSPDGQWILTASDDQTARVWDTSGKLVALLKQGKVRSVSFSPDGKRIVTASADGIARVWDTSGKLLAELKGHQCGVGHPSFSPDGKLIVTASNDNNTACVWDTSGKLLSPASCWQNSEGITQKLAVLVLVRMDNRLSLHPLTTLPVYGTFQPSCSLNLGRLKPLLPIERKKSNSLGQLIVVVISTVPALARMAS
jgi:WD40 repeat protein